MMRIGYSLWGMPRVPVEESLPALAAMGYQGVELSVRQEWNTELAALDGPYRAKIARLLDDTGLVLSAVAAHQNLCDLDEQATEASMAYLRASMDLAAELAQAGEPPIVASLVGGAPDDWDGRKELLAQRIHALGEYAQAQGVILAVEPHSGTALDLPDKTIWLLDQVAHPAVKLNFDISHMDVMGIGIDECVPTMAPYAIHTHVKDQRGIWPQHEFLTPGEGPFDFEHYLRAMHAASYGGFVVAEVSVMVQRRGDYEPMAHAQLAYDIFECAFQATGVPWER
jgi:sugar phosphate isomerase/epimerase